MCLLGTATDPRTPQNLTRIPPYLVPDAASSTGQKTTSAPS
jgi:hypothetical protein